MSRAIPLLLDVPPVRPADAAAVLDLLSNADAAAVLFREGGTVTTPRHDAADALLRAGDDPWAAQAAVDADLSNLGVDPSVLAARLTALGGPAVVVEASTGRHAPYNLARRVQSLARITGGRAGLLLRDGGLDPLTAASGAQPTPGAFAEYVAVVRALWASFPAEALVGDAESGVFADLSLLAPPAFDGATYRVAGSLNVPAAHDERPVLLTERPESALLDGTAVDGIVGPADPDRSLVGRRAVDGSNGGRRDVGGSRTADAGPAGDATTDAVAALVVRVPARPGALADALTRLHAATATGVVESLDPVALLAALDRQAVAV